MAERQVQICTSTDCRSKGSQALIKDLEDLCAETSIDVVPSVCQNHCGKGPNVTIFTKGKAGKVNEGIGPFKAIEKLLKVEVGIELKSLQKQVAEIKYEIRRSKDSGDKAAKLAKAFKVLGGEERAVVQEPRQAFQLLVMRARDVVGSNPNAALKDAQQATEICPDAAQGFVMVASAFEKLGKWEESLKAAEQAIEKGDARDATGILKRMKDKMKEQAAKQAAAEAEEKAKQKAFEDEERREEAENKNKRGAAKKKLEVAAAKKLEAEAQKKAKEEAKKLAAEQEAQRKAEEAEKAEEEARKLAEEEERARAEAEAKAKAEEEEEEEKRKKEQEEARRKEDERKILEEARLKAEAEVAEKARLEEEERRVYQASFKGRLEAMMACCRPPDVDTKDRDADEEPVKVS